MLSDLTEQNLSFSLNVEFNEEVTELNKLRSEFLQFTDKLLEIDLNNIEDKDQSALYDLFFSNNFINLSDKIHNAFKIRSSSKRVQLLQILANNIRNGGCIYCYNSVDNVTVFNIVYVINKLIESHREENKRSQIVIDSLRNPLEIMFLRERYSAFYMIAINKDEDEINETLKKNFNVKNDYGDIVKIDLVEYKGGSSSEFYKQNVSDCIQKADIHISNINEFTAKEFNLKLKENKDNTSPKYSVEMQLLKYIALITQPGIVTPSPEERCMQLAYTAKYNSGCISRQVGAAITDEFYSIQAIGWNNTPEGQVPCSLRNAEDLINKNNDYDAFTPFEKKDTEFQKVFSTYYNTAEIESKKKLLNGRNVCFCFKTLKNSYSEGKNQVHTRSLHAEESAFLQITKYGGNGIRNGKLFTTASPCELCSKKAYQLGIKVIYYIDPYPGISKTQILEGGKEGRNPEVRLFHGIIGNAYHWLYQPFMGYKDELSLILGHEIKDFTKIQDTKIKELQSIIDGLTKENEKLMANSTKKN